ncbi:MAG: sensor histidine kinase [Bacteroidales bacterium]
MMKLRYKLSLFNILSKSIFGLLFIIIMPMILERVNTIQTDNELIKKREQVIDLIAMWGVDFFIKETRDDAFGSYNILKEEYISLEKIDLNQHWNFIEVTKRRVEDEIIDYRVLNYTLLIDGEMFLLEIGKSLSSIKQTEKNITTFTLIFLLAFILISGLMDISFASFLVRPLEKITAKLRKTPSPVLYDPEPVKTNTSEFLYLENTLHELMQKINKLFQKEKETTANISHELLTPISVLRSKLENLLSQADLPDEASSKTEEALKTIHRLKVMVNSLLLVARVESEQYLKEDNFLTSTVINDIEEELKPLSDDKNILIKKEIKEDKLLKKANRSLIFTMFYNIVNNAIKFTPEGGHIQIISQNNQEVFQILIRDDGPGMNENQLKNIFTRFKNRHAHPENGTGIGLAISKTIADFHHITIDVNSTPGKGTEFIFTFPA